jgi:5'-methylthioadenosine phosphorylase
MIAIIGGTGVGKFPLDEEPKYLTVETPWGVAAAQTGTLRGKPLVFLARHGAGHKVPPHRINYRANIAALVKLGVRGVLATTAVGSLNVNLQAGSLVLLDDFIDFTLARQNKTFFDGENGSPVVHTDFTHPYSPELRAALLTAAEATGTLLQPKGTYLCGDGPRYETPAEVRLFAGWGADVVGMTGVPEATLAREAGLHYAGVSLVTNLGCGLSPTPLTHTEVEEAMAAAAPRLRTLLIEAVSRIDADALPPIGPGVALPGFP